MKSDTIRSYEKLRYIYQNNLTVDLLCENLNTCNFNDHSIDVKNEMVEKDFDMYGVEKEGKIIGFVRRDELDTKGIIGDFVKNFSSDDLISDSTSLIELLDIFQEWEYVFILEKNKVSKIVTVADLQKQPIRMLAFSLISLFEMYLISTIREFFPDDSWTDKLTEARLTKAKELLEERSKKNEALTLLDNIQLGDKGTIVRKTPQLVEKFGFESNQQCKDFFRNIETLRNNTAHSQEKIYHDYKELIAVILQIEKVLKN